MPYLLCLVWAAALAVLAGATLEDTPCSLLGASNCRIETNQTKSSDSKCLLHVSDVQENQENWHTRLSGDFIRKVTIQKLCAFLYYDMPGLALQAPLSPDSMAGTVRVFLGLTMHRGVIWVRLRPALSAVQQFFGA
jgi:hypothetical protein